LGQDFNAVYFLIVIAVVGAVFALMRRIDRSPYGRVLRAIREDAQVAQVAGKPVLHFKAQAFALSAAIAGLAGALYGNFTSYIAPDLFLPLITVYIFLAVAAGGTGSPIGALVGAYLLMTLLESARFVVAVIPAVTAVQRAALKELLIAVTLIVVLRLMPSGLLPERIPPAPRPQTGGTT
jgi:branched-chain amino acid transport system permease protein